MLAYFVVLAQAAAPTLSDASTVPVSWLLGVFGGSASILGLLVKLWIGGTEKRIADMVADNKMVVGTLNQHSTDIGRLQDRVDRLERDVEKLQDGRRAAGAK